MVQNEPIFPYISPPNGMKCYAYVESCKPQNLRSRESIYALTYVSLVPTKGARHRAAVAMGTQYALFKSEFSNNR